MNINDCLKKDMSDLKDNERKMIVDNLCQRFLIEHKKNDKSGIYSKTQYMFAFNSNHMEGSTLTEEQTRHLFQTGTLPKNPDIYIAKDIEEAQGHFLMFNDMIQNYHLPLSEELIKKFHFRLKQGVFEDHANGYPCGEYKNRSNFVSDITTAKPNEVSDKMKELLAWYDKVDKTVESLMIFHAKYEKIHPFQDGNGRTGRIILFKECLKNGIVPVLITEDISRQYKMALNRAQNKNDFQELFDVAKRCQENYYKYIQEFLYDYSLDLSEIKIGINDRVKKAEEQKEDRIKEVMKKDYTR